MMVVGLSNKKYLETTELNRVYQATVRLDSFCLDLYVNTFYKEQINSGDFGYGNMNSC
jgi:hypothetical protein